MMKNLFFTFLSFANKVSTTLVFSDLNLPDPQDFEEGFVVLFR